MRELLNVISGHHSAVYDPRWLGATRVVGREDIEESDKTLFHHIFSYYQESLFCNQHAIRFCQKLGIDDESLLMQYGVGFVDRTLGKQFPSGDTPEGARLRGKLQRLGLLKASGGEFFRGALVFPNINKYGDVSEVYGERITPNLRSGTPYQLYWSLSSSDFFNRSALTHFDEVFLCKSPLEALMLESSGHSNVVATMGLQGFDVDQLEALSNNRISSVTLAFENTVEGERTCRLVAQALSLYGIACYRMLLPFGSDLKRYVLEQGVSSIDALIHERQACVQTYEGIKGDSAW